MTCSESNLHRSIEVILCDKLYAMHSIKNMKEMSKLLIESFMIEEDALESLETETVEMLSARYHSRNVKILLTYLRSISSDRIRTPLY